MKIKPRLQTGLNRTLMTQIMLIFANFYLILNTEYLMLYPQYSILNTQYLILLLNPEIANEIDGTQTRLRDGQVMQIILIFADIHLILNTQYLILNTTY